MSILAGIDGMIEAWLGITDPRFGESPRYSSKTAAQELTRAKGPLVERGNGNLLVELLQRLQENWTNAGQHKPSADTWALGKELHLSPDNTSQEVVLERLVVRLLDDTWANQVPTCSGLIRGANEGKRSIDLVHECDEKRYEFIELKFKDGGNGGFGSNYPLHAAWEVIEYGLLYVHARQNELRNDSQLMKARSIRLVVLAPAGWYQGYDFSWLEAEVNRWLQAPEFSDVVNMDFQFQEFTTDFDKIYNAPNLLPIAVQEFRRADLRDRKPVSWPREAG